MGRPAGPRSPRGLSPSQLLVLTFVGLIAAGTLLLILPSASAGARLTVIQALFTATSAVCVTGLVVVDTPTGLSTFGQVVVLVLIQAGGLGYMTLSTLVAAALGRRTTLQERMTLRESLNASQPGEIMRFARTVLGLTLVFEGIGATVLALRWSSEYGAAEATWLGVFHAVSAFNNAGFALFSDSLMGFAADPVIILTIGGLVTIGGLGFFTINELLHARRGTIGLSLHSRLVLWMSAGLVAAGTIAFFALERGNPATLGPLSTGAAWMTAWFQSVVPRTAGFNSLAIGACTPATLFLIMVLMFIGGGPGSTAGGVKITTFGITVAALWATVRGNTDAVLFQRRLPADTVARAFFVCLIGFLLLNVVAVLLLMTQGRALLPVVFESVSAFGTVGLSMGDGSASPLSLAGHLTGVGQLLLAALMFAGRIGPLTLAVALARRTTGTRVRYPEGKVLIG